MNNLILPTDVRHNIEDVIEEFQRADVLRNHGVEPRNRVLFTGPPGNGKTTLAETIAEALGFPLYVVQYDGLVGSFLGETSERLRQLFDFANKAPGVFFFDEFDTIGKERGDNHEVGEIKRVVSTLLMQIDSLSSDAIIVVASNHPELLDRAVWRRFQLHVDLPKPDQGAIQTWLKRFEIDANFNWPDTTDNIAEKLHGLSFAEIEHFAFDVYRPYILSLSDTTLHTLFDRSLKRAQARLR